MTIDSCVTLGTERDTVYRAGVLVRDMDRAGVDMAVVAPGDRETAVHNRQGNDFILAESSLYPDRLIPACTVNPWYGSGAMEELIRAVDRGARMLVLHPTIQGFLMNDELADPLLDQAWMLNVPVYVHTGGHLYGSPWQLVDAALRHPSTTFIMGHAGATDFWNDVHPAASTAPNVFIEGSFARPFIFRSHVDAVGVGRAVMGSAAPRNDLAFEWEQYRSYMDPGEYGPVFGANMARLLGLKCGEGV